LHVLTVGSRPKVLQNNSKPAKNKESDWQGKLAAIQPPFLDKSGRKKIFYDKQSFLH
jgi:hypothetical protein